VDKHILARQTGLSRSQVIVDFFAALFAILPTFQIICCVDFLSQYVTIYLIKNNKYTVWFVYKLLLIIDILSITWCFAYLH
jgi:hypothetical protein